MKIIFITSSTICWILIFFLIVMCSVIETYKKRIPSQFVNQNFKSKIPEVIGRHFYDISSYFTKLLAQAKTTKVQIVI